VEGGYTKYLPSGEQMSIFEAAEKYKADGTGLVVLAGKEYGTGSSRDWAAKGTLLLGIRAVIAESYERIHRANLVGMGVLPLQFMPGENPAELGLDGTEVYDFEDLSAEMAPNAELKVMATKADGEKVEFKVVTRLDTAIDVEYYNNGGILHTVLRDRLSS
jgi:aconitate hydratase